MSLYGALFAGVSGLSAQSSAMGAIADNVTNVNTNGYKGTKVNFQTLITKQAASTKYSAGGVQSKPRQNVDLQGLLQSTSSSTDVGISGNGFFVVNSKANPTTGDGAWGYTRAGSFKVDKAGYMQNVGGWYVQGWPLLPIATPAAGDSTSGKIQVGTDWFQRAYKDADGVLHPVNENTVNSTEMKPLNLNELGGTASATKAVRMGANLPSTDVIGDTHTTSVLSYDSLGNSSTIDYVWEKKAANKWDMEAVPPPGSIGLSVLDTNSAVYSSMGRLDFLKAATAGETFTIAAGAGPTTYTFTIVAGASSGIATAGAAFNLTNSTLDQMVTDATLLVNEILHRQKLPVAGVVGASTAEQFARRPAGTDSIVFTAADKDATAAGGAAIPAISVNLSGLTTASTVTQQAYAPGDPATITQPYTIDAIPVANDPYGTNAVVFNGDGTPQAVVPKSVKINWSNGAEQKSTAPQTFTMFLGSEDVADGMTQFSGPFQINYVNQNGSAFGNFASVSVGSDGLVTALFDNGVNRPVFQIPLATFPNPNGMESLTGNVWIETNTSGMHTLRTAGSSGAGSTNGGSLEASTVDLGEEFTAMITTQRAYSASAKIITTADEMLDELVRIKR